MSDTAPTNIRERLWVEKVDKTVDPPQVVEEIFIENGQIMEVKVLRQSQPNSLDDDPTP